ncbi:hypothetical protein EDE08_101664 [Bradyrhizobium sp. R2.2-H]|jgi:hypothetical protein|nr:hypothetical protein EDE10_101665 [Bradyrhizobium sp. Y-H1]TCU80964.1 hypothetical protein EDE08_101664 [Bradyrhizobium sp. R2.2-H]
MIDKFAIEKAIEGGWKHFEGLDKKEASLYAHNILALSDWQTIALDRTFWQALGKALGWEQKAGMRVTSIGTADHYEAGWSENAHRFYDLILTGGDMEKWWQELLAN